MCLGSFLLNAVHLSPTKALALLVKLCDSNFCFSKENPLKLSILIHQWSEAEAALQKKS